MGQAGRNLYIRKHLDPVPVSRARRQYAYGGPHEPT